MKTVFNPLTPPFDKVSDQYSDIGGLTTGSLVFADVNGNLSQDNSNLFWDNTNKRMGIGTNAPEAQLELAGNGSVDFHVTRYQNNSSSPTNRQRKARGTMASPANVQSGDNLGNFSFNGYAGGFVSPAIMRAVVNGTVTTGIVPADLFFSTMNASGSVVERLRILFSGEVGIGTTVPTAKLDINGDTLRLRTAKTPASSGASGNQGDMCWDSDYEYRCVATNTWKRIALTTF